MTARTFRPTETLLDRVPGVNRHLCRGLVAASNATADTRTFDVLELRNVPLSGPLFRTPVEAKRILISARPGKQRVFVDSALRSYSNAPNLFHPIRRGATPRGTREPLAVVDLGMTNEDQPAEDLVLQALDRLGALRRTALVRPAGIRPPWGPLEVAVQHAATAIETDLSPVIVTSSQFIHEAFLAFLADKQPGLILKRNVLEDLAPGNRAWHQLLQPAWFDSIPAIPSACHWLGDPSARRRTGQYNLWELLDRNPTLFLWLTDFAKDDYERVYGSLIPELQKLLFTIRIIPDRALCLAVVNEYAERLGMKLEPNAARTLTRMGSRLHGTTQVPDLDGCIQAVRILYAVQKKKDSIGKLTFADDIPSALRPFTTTIVKRDDERGPNTKNIGYTKDSRYEDEEDEEEEINDEHDE